MLVSAFNELSIAKKMAPDENKEKEKTYPLHKVIRTRNIHKLKILLSSVKDINATNEMGFPPLLYACEQRSNDEMLGLLLEQKGINPLGTDAEGQNALHILAFHGQLNWINTFFEKFSFGSVDTVTLKGNTPFIMAAKMDHVDILQYLFKKGANVNHKNKKNFTALHYAANNGYTSSIKKLIELGSDIDPHDDRGCTPLIKASSWNFIEAVKILLNHGAGVHKKDKLGNTALASAARRGYCKIVEVLLENGADPNCETMTEYEMVYTPIITACKNNNIDMLKLLIKNGSNVNHPGNYSQALFHCIKLGFTEGVNELIKAGVDLRGRHAQNGKTPLEQARKFRKGGIAELIQRNL